MSDDEHTRLGEEAFRAEEARREIEDAEEEGAYWQEREEEEAQEAAEREREREAMEAEIEREEAEQEKP